jgi:predicted transcriptional regulator
MMTNFPLHVKHHRNRYEIVNEILLVVLSRTQSVSSFYKCKLLHIAYDAGLSYSQLLYYLDRLVAERLLLMTKPTKSEPHPLFEITDKGRHYLKVFAGLQRDMHQYSIGESRQSVVNLT